MNRITLLSAAVIFAAFAGVAGHPYGGCYIGAVTTELSGAVNVEERGIGVFWATVHDDGSVTTASGMTGAVDDAGAITWDLPNSESYTTGQITEGDLYSEATRSDPGLNTTFRLRAALHGGLGAAVIADLQTISPYPNSGLVRDIIHDGQRFVAVTEYRSVLFSDDGVTWEERGIPANDELNTIAYGNGVYVVGGEDRNFFYTDDPDLEDWVALPSPTANLLTTADFVDITYGNGAFVAISHLGAVSSPKWLFTSTDGISWQAITGVGPGGLSVAFMNGKFVATGIDRIVGTPEAQVLTSTDGINWTTPVSLGASSNPSARGLSGFYGNGTYVIPMGSRKQVITSSDGVTWSAPTSTSLNGTGSTVSIYGAYFNGTHFVSTTGHLSTDGVDWTTAPESGNSKEGIAFDGQTYVKVGWDVASSTNLTEWTIQTGGILNQFVDGFANITEMMAGNGVVVLRGNPAPLLWSKTGYATDWHEAEFEDGAPTPTNIVSGNGLLAGIGDGQVVTSADGAKWRVAGTAPAVSRLFFANGRFWAFGTAYQRSVVYESVDAVNWTLTFRETTGLPATFSKIIYDQGNYLGLVSAGAVYRSTDMVYWEQAVYVASEATGMAKGNGLVMAVGTSAGTGQGDVRVQVTDDGGETWASQRLTQFANDRPSAIGFVDGRFIVHAQGGGANSILSTTDGLSWTE